MKTTTIAFVLGVTLTVLGGSTVAAAKSVAAVPPKSTETIDTLSVKYLDGLFKFRPHLASFMGDHRFDRQIADFSDASCAQRSRELTELATALAKLPRESLTLDQSIDTQLLADGIALERLYLDEIKDWAWDPRLYDSFPYYDPREMIAARLGDIIHGDFAPEADRRETVRVLVEKLNALLPDLEKRFAANAARVPKLYAERAIATSKGRSEFLNTEVAEFLGKKGQPHNLAKANDHFTAFLEKDLLPRATGDWRLGPELYAKKFPLALQTDKKPLEMVALAEAYFLRSRGELYQLARRIWPRLFPKDPLPPVATDKKLQAQLIDKVRDELAKQHAAPDKLVDAHAKNLDHIRDFIVAHNVVELPPRETLTVEAMPIWKRGAVAAEYLAPGVLEKRTDWHATYYVDPIDPTWPADKVESYLRGQNDFAVQLVAIHEAYPGHHTQFFHSKKSQSALRAVLWNAPFAEGWAVYGEGLMVAAGYGDTQNDAFKFFELRGQLTVAANLILDVKLQSKLITDEEAVRFMAEEGFQEKAMAEKKLVRAKLDSTQLAQYFLGLSEIEELERDVRKQKGTAFTQRDFNTQLIGHGPIAVKYARRYLLK